MKLIKEAEETIYNSRFVPVEVKFVTEVEVSGEVLSATLAVPWHEYTAYRSHYTPHAVRTNRRLIMAEIERRIFGE